MMTLPRFTNPNPVLSELWVEQDRLHNQAHKLINETGIFDVSSEAIDKLAFGSLVGELAINQHVRKIATADGVNFVIVQKGRPKGYWIRLEIPFEDDRWGIDCWLQQPNWMKDDADIYADRLSELDQSSRDVILQIKYDLIRKSVYGKTIFYGDVYDAVLDRGVRSLSDFNTLMINTSQLET